MAGKQPINAEDRSINDVTLHRTGIWSCTNFRVISPHCGGKLLL